VANLEHNNQQTRLLNAVEDPEGSGADAVNIGIIPQFPASPRPEILGKALDNMC